MGKQTADNRPYKLGLTSKHKKYTLEGVMMGRCADKNGPDKLSLKSQTTGT